MFNFTCNPNSVEYPPFFDDIKHEVAKIIREKMEHYTKDLNNEETLQTVVFFCGWFVMNLIPHHVKIFYQLRGLDLAKGYLQHIKGLIMEIEETIEKEGTNV